MRTLRCCRLDGTAREPAPVGSAVIGLRRTMLDIVFVASGLAFFALAAGYAALCERL